MSLRIRKSIKIAKGVRLNLNKDSVGLSVGGKAGRYSVNSKGRTTTTIHTPISGVSYVDTHSNKSSNNLNNSTQYVERPKKEMKTGLPMFVITLFFGMFGVHRFISGQFGMGVLYFFTGGIFFIGWIADVIYQLKHLKVQLPVQDKVQE